MDSLKCVIIDDELAAVNLLNLYVKKIDHLESVLATTNVIEALNYVQQHHVDIIFLDIEMPELNGIQFLKIFNGGQNVIITSAYTQYAIDGYEYNVIDYLLKPIPFERFARSIQKALSVRLQPGSSDPSPLLRDFVFVKTDRGKVARIIFGQVLYVESLGNYAQFIFEKEKVLTIITIKELEEILPKKIFTRINRSFIINNRKVEAIDAGEVIINKVRIPIGNTYKEAYLESIKKDLL